MVCVCCVYNCCVGFFFFKQKTAYEMRISDWSSDVCSSDLAFIEDVPFQGFAVVIAGGLRQPDLDHLARIVPFVDGGGDVQPLIALQPEQAATQGLRPDRKSVV